MAWRAITEGDLLQKISGSELEALRAAALSSSQDDPVQTQIDLTTDMVRGHIAAAGIDLDPDNPAYLPERLIGPACDVIILDVMTRAAGTVIDPEDQRRENAEQARKLFERVAEGKYSIDDYSSGSESAGPVRPRYVPGRSARRFDRSSQEGL